MASTAGILMHRCCTTSATRHLWRPHQPAAQCCPPAAPGARWFGSKKAKPKGRPQVSGTAGRIATQQGGKKKRKSSAPRLCVGCGTEVVAGSTGGSIFSTGADAVGASSTSKRQARRAKFADLSEPSMRGSTAFLCDRCKVLQSQNIWAAYDAIQDVDATVFAQQLGHVVGRRRFGLCIVVADATDAEHSAPKHLRRTIGSTPAILVLSKCDLLPRLDPREIQRLEQQIGKITGNRFFRVFDVSARTGAGILDLSEYLLSNLRGRDVFIVGAANVGKSTLVQRLAGTLAPNIYMKGKARAARSRKKALSDLPVTASHLPGTTLQAVRVPCFPSARHALWDTPGIIQSKAIQYSLFPPHFLEPLARALPIPLQPPIQIRAGQTVLIEAAWMDANYREDDDQDYDSDTDEEEDRNRRSKPLPPLEKTCVFARVDVVSVQGRQRRNNSVWFRPYLHPSLRLRVVPQDEAPMTATLPPHHVRRIQARLQRPNDKVITTRPLAIYATPQNPDGQLKPTDKQRSLTGRVYMDVVFASLGWLHCANSDDLVLRPWCVEGSVYSKRPALYPTHLDQADIEQQHIVWAEQAAILESPEACKRLALAARKGSKNLGKPDYHRRGGGGETEDFVSLDDDGADWFL